MAKVHLVVGPVGAGKTTFALQLAQERQAIFLNLDEWMTNLFRPDRPEIDLWEWYRDRVERCKHQIKQLSESALSVGIEVILELGLVFRSDRDLFFCWLDSMECELKVYVLDAPRNIRRARVIKRNVERGPTFSMEVPADIFEFASDLWQPLEEDELIGRDVVVRDEMSMNDICSQSAFDIA